MEFLRKLGLDPEPRERPFGVYVEGKKIASFGVDLEQGVCRHGVAIYYSPQHVSFQGINPCGNPGERFTSLEEELRERLPTWDAAASCLAESVIIVFNRKKS